MIAACPALAQSQLYTLAVGASVVQRNRMFFAQLDEIGDNQRRMGLRMQRGGRPLD